MRLKGRHVLMVWLLIFLCVLLAITTRQTAGFRTARRLRDLQEERLLMEARRADLERRVRAASSRQVLVPIVQRTLGLHEPADSEFILFPLPGTAEGARQ